MAESLCYRSNGIIFFRKHMIPKKRTVLKRLGVKPRSFAGGMISRMYDYYFDGAIDFDSEYKKYYSKEFSSTEQFIEERFNIEHERAAKYARG